MDREGFDERRVLRGAVAGLDSMVRGMEGQWDSLGYNLAGLWDRVAPHDVYELGSGFMELSRVLVRLRAALNVALLQVGGVKDADDDELRRRGDAMWEEHLRHVAESGGSAATYETTNEFGKSLLGHEERKARSEELESEKRVLPRHLCDEVAHRCWGAMVADFRGGIGSGSHDGLSYTNELLFRVYAVDTKSGRRFPVRMYTHPSDDELGELWIPCVDLRWRDGFLVDVGDVRRVSVDEVLDGGVHIGEVPVPLDFGEMVYEGEARVRMFECFMRYFWRCMWAGVDISLCLLHEELMTVEEVFG